jgi:hypothetical protein
MSPGPVTSHTRGGNAFYNTRTTPASRIHGRACASPYGRTLAGQRNSFSVGMNEETGAHEVNLSDNEIARLGLDADGALTVTVENKPAEPEEENGNGNGSGDGADDEEERQARQRISWSRETGGSILFEPAGGEVLDAMAIASRPPSPSTRSPDHHTPMRAALEPTSLRGGARLWGTPRREGGGGPGPYKPSAGHLNPPYTTRPAHPSPSRPQISHMRADCAPRHDYRASGTAGPRHTDASDETTSSPIRPSMCTNVRAAQC